MTHNKILTAAVVAALSMGGGIAQAASSVSMEVAATPSVIAPDGSTVAPVYVAYELFAYPETDPITEGTLPCTAAVTGVCTTAGQLITLDYKLDEDDIIDKDFIVTFALTGAKFKTEPSVQQVWNATTAETIVISPESITSTSVKYIVKASDKSIDKDAVFRLGSFTVEVNEADFAKPGAKVDMAISTTGEVTDNVSITLLETKAGSGIAIGKDGKSAIDVNVSGFAFDPGISNEVRRAKIGKLIFSSNSMKDKDLTTIWTPATTTKTATVTSLPGLPDDPNTKVYLDIGTNCDRASSPEDAVLDSDDHEATWSSVTATVGTPYYVCIELPEDNDKEVTPNELIPRMLFTAKYTNGVEISTAGNLRQIKRNGALCKVYNVTSTDTQDITNINIFNLSGKEVTAKGTLYDMEGNVVFQNVVLGTLAPKQKLYLNSEKLVEYAEDAMWGRGVLVISGTFPINQMEVFASLRRKSVDGIGSFPLLNMSKGASKTACE